MITISLTDVASACGLTADCICSLARKLIAGGHDPTTPVIAKRFNPKPLGFWADLTVVESETRSIRFRKYKPWPKDLFR